MLQQQVSVEAKEKIRRERKALKTTTLIIGALIACYTPFSVVFSLNIFHTMPKDMNYTLFSLLMIPVILIYTTKNREFRVSFIQLLARKSIQQAQEIEMRYFRSPNLVTALQRRH